MASDPASKRESIASAAQRGKRIGRVFPRTLSDASLGKTAENSGEETKSEWITSWPNECSTLQNVKMNVSRALGDDYIPEVLPGLEQQCSTLFAFLEDAMVRGRNDAALLMGVRGGGKTAALRHTFRALKRKHNPLGRSFVEVYVNGLIQTDDTHALREICRQLSLEMELEPLPKKEAHSFERNLEFLMEVLQSCQKQNLSVFFVLDELHNFARRSKQTLLYNLSDLLQSGVARLAIIGITPNVDAYQLLEKRVRSRISYRRVVFGPVPDVLTLKRIILQRMSVSVAADSHLETSTVAAGSAVGAAAPDKSQPSKPLKGSQRKRKRGKQETVEEAETESKGEEAERHDDKQLDESERKTAQDLKRRKTDENCATSAAAVYQRGLLELFGSGENKLEGNDQMEALLQSYVDIGRDIRWVFVVISWAVAKLSDDHPRLTVQDFKEASTALSGDYLLETLKSCSVSELCLVAGMLHLEQSNITPYNFALCYNEYSKFARQEQMLMGDMYSKAACIKGFERLLHHGVISAADGAVSSLLTPSSTSELTFMAVQLSLHPDDVRRLFDKGQLDCPVWLRQWACKWTR